MITAKVVEDTIWNDKRITTMELTMPRFILAQFNTHRMFSRNTASSRAIPVSKMIEMVQSNPVIPVYWGKNMAGMVAHEEIVEIDKALQIWTEALNNAVDTAIKFNGLNLHKQIANRILEPFMMCKTLVTATEWDNFFELRLAHDAQPEIQALAHAMKEAMENSKPKSFKYHLPYITEDDYEDVAMSNTEASEEDGNKYIYQELAMISAARCARVSYLNHDNSNPVRSKDRELANKLLNEKHLSPFEHQAEANTEVEINVIECEFDDEQEQFGQPLLGFTEASKVRFNNFFGWRQYRYDLGY